MTQGDVASWFVAGSYKVRAPAAHRYSAGMSYSTQRYDGGNPVALAAVSASGRNAGVLHAADEWTISPAVVLSYGTRYAHYDYLNGRDLFSPRVSFEWNHNDRLRVRTIMSRTALAPGAEEFFPPLVAGLWVPPERTFSPLVRNGTFRSETTDHYELALERDLTSAYVVSFRTFYQRIDDQLSALFGIHVPSNPNTNVGHYYITNTGDAQARGWGVGLRRPLGNGLRGSVDYTLTTADWSADPDARQVRAVARSVVRPDHERFHDLTTSVEKEIPQTSTRVYAMYKFNNAFAREGARRAGLGADARFDVQVNQALPFLNFSTAEWEVLLAVRNTFREAMAESSVFDELQVVRPPKRIVGGVLVRF
jgi:outer membrane receptor for ferrienterochelin and colicin